MSKSTLYNEIYMIFKEAREKIVTNLMIEEASLSKDDIEKLNQIANILDNIIHKIMYL